MNNEYANQLSATTNQKLTDNKFRAKVKIIDYLPTLKEHQFVGSDKHYPTRPTDIVLSSDDITVTFNELAGKWIAENGGNQADKMLWSVYFKTADETFYTQDNSRTTCDDGCKLVGFIHTVKPVKHYHTKPDGMDQVTPSELYEAETKHIEQYLQHLGLALKGKILQILIYNKEGNLVAGTDYQPILNDTTFDTVVDSLISRGHT